jgi:hypothetical protein
MVTKSLRVVQLEWHSQNAVSVRVNGHPLNGVVPARYTALTGRSYREYGVSSLDRLLSGPRGLRH